MIFFVYCMFIVILGSSKYSSADDYMKVKAPYVKTCQIKDPNFVACSTESIQNMFQQLIHGGFDGLDTLHSIDPLKLNRITIFQGDGPVSLNSSLSKAVVTGFANMIVTESKVSSKNYSWRTKIKIPKMRIEGQYNMNGRILVIPLIGRGKCWFEPVNMDILLKTKTHLYEKGGHVFYNVTHTKVDYTISGLTLRLNNLFEGVPELEESTNAYLNENWQPVAEALKPIISKTIEDILLDVLSKIFHFLPADYLISDIPKPGELYGY